MFEFAYLYCLLALPLPIVVYWFIPKAETREAALKVPFYSALSQMAGQSQRTATTNRFSRILAIFMWVLLVIAAAKPQWVGDPIPLHNEGRDLLLAVDLSDSMRTEDMLYQGRNLTRISVVKEVVSDFVEKRHSDRLGLILFGDNAYLQAPLTFDRQTVKQLLQEAQLGFAGNSTAIGDAIALGIKRLKERPDAARVLILLTDGENTAGEIEPRQAAELATLAGVKVHTVGVASDQIIDSGGFFSRKRMASAGLDEEALQYIASQTGGEYFRARDTKDLNAIYDTLNTIETIEQDERVYRPITSLMHWPLLAALLLSFMIAISRSALFNNLLDSQRLDSQKITANQSPQKESV